MRDFVGSVGACWTRSPQPLQVDGRLQFDEDGNEIHARIVYYYGVAEDAKMAMELFDTLRQTVATAARLRCGGTHRGTGRSYAEGFVAGLYTKLHEAKRLDSEASEQSRALIVQSTAIAKAAKQRAIAWRESETGEKVRRRAIRSVGHSGNGMEAYYQGRKDGQRAEVSAARKSKLTGESQKRLA